MGKSMEEQVLEHFKSEYAKEVRSSEITLDDLLGLEIPESALKAEMLLRVIYGDEYYKEFVDDRINENAKTIEKIGEQELSLNNELTSKIAKMEADEFNKVLEKILVKV